MINLSIFKVFGLTAFTFFLAITVTPIFTHYLYKYKMWKKKSRSAEDNPVTEDFKKIHNHDAEINTPRAGGVIIWGCASLVAILMWAVYQIFPTDLTAKLNFLSKNQTWLPLFVLVSASIVGLIDDLLQIYEGNKKEFFSDGLPRKLRILIVAIIGAIGAYWFYYKLGMSAVYIPYFGELQLGWLFIPFFIITMLAVFSGGVIDGVDGLSGGVMASIFSAYGGIAYFQNQVDIATFCMVITASILAFLWFNIPPARFYMGETGMLGLTATLTVVAFLTDAVAVLPVIAFPLLIESASSIIQMTSRRCFNGKKVFKVAPLHNHFIAMGWSRERVTMRFWVMSIFFAIFGMVLTLIK